MRLKFSKFLPVVISKRNTWVVTRALPGPITSEGCEQRPPTDKLDFMKYSVLEQSHEKCMPMAKIILIKTVEGIGKAGEVVEVRSHMVREFFFPSQSAVYASPYNVKKYSNLLGANEKGTVEPYVKLGISKSVYDLSLYLNSKAVPIYLALENDWTLQKWHIVLAMALHDIKVEESQLILNKEQVSGPFIKLQNQLFRFYVMVNKRIVIPAYGRYQHVTIKTFKQMLTPSLPDPTLLDETQTENAGLVEEDLYIHHPSIDNQCSTDDIRPLSSMNDHEIWDLMVQKAYNKKQEMASNPVLISKRQQAILDAEAQRKKEKEIYELRCRSFHLPYLLDPLDEREMALKKQRARRNRYYDDDDNVWPYPLGKF